MLEVEFIEWCATGSVPEASRKRSKSRFPGIVWHVGNDARMLASGKKLFVEVKGSIW